MRRYALLASIVVVAAALVAVVAARALSDSSDAAPQGQCDVGLGSYQSPLDGALLSRAEERLDGTIALASAGDLEAAREAFFPFAHALLHQVDTRLREEGEEGLAKQLCEAVLTLEADFVLLDIDPARLADDARALRLLAEEATHELRLEREEGEG
jgi:hypothetical protein